MGNWAETQRVRARVTFAGGRSIEGDLHMQPCTALHRDVETPLEMLNRPEEFFAITLPSSGVALVAKSQTTLVTCTAMGSDIDSDEALGGKSVRLDVMLSDGAEVSGCAHWALPPTSARPIDFLNTIERFFALTDDATTHYVNRGFVQEVHPLD